MTSTNLRAGFVHRHNDDGTVDSVCRACFMTVATEVSESELMKDEQDHDCHDLARNKQYASRKNSQETRTASWRRVIDFVQRDL